MGGDAPRRGPLIFAGTDDDAIMWWLSTGRRRRRGSSKHYLWTHSATGNTASGGTRTLPHSGLVKIYAGARPAFFGVPPSDPRHPDVWGVVQVGVVYTGGKGKIAEHGGANPADRDVPIVVYAPGAVSPRRVGCSGSRRRRSRRRSCTSSGSTPCALQAVQIEGTKVLPGIGRH